MRHSFRLLLPLLALVSQLLGCAGAPKRPQSSATPSRAAERERRQERSCDRFCNDIRDAVAGFASEHSSQSELLCAIARCETGNKCISDIRSPGGRYHGAFQFAAPTWKSVCYPIFETRKMPECRSPEARSEIACSSVCAAQMISEPRGIRHWPTCGKKARRALSSAD